MSIDDILINNSYEVYNHKLEKFPSVFYFGLGKTGSQSLCRGFIKNKVAHWHNEEYFSRIYKINENINLLEIAENTFNDTKIKPLIIECFREPISRSISSVFQHISSKKFTLPENDDNQIEFIIAKIIFFLTKQYHLCNNASETYIPYATNWKKYNIDILQFDKNKKYFYKESEKMKFLFLRYEDIKLRKNIITNLGYEFNDIKINATRDKQTCRSYDEIYKYCKFSKDFLQKIYNDIYVSTFYTNKEIEIFIKNFSILP